jgi:oxygen-independent coproporphyrinogen-3 oxidase
MQYKDSIVSEYVAVLLKQISGLKEKFKSIYVGGGTPTILSDKLLYELLNSLSKLRSGDCEFTVEANPDSLDSGKLSILSGEGVNRISIGIQSLDDRILNKLGRIHNAAQAENAVYIAKEKGFNDISIDLIFGIWGQTLSDWSNELKRAVKMPITHISCYSLNCEKNTPLHDLVEDGTVVLCDDKLSADMYEYTIDYLPANGFCQYEVSNFAKENHCCRHNIHYWENNSYEALGPSSVSYVDGIRQANVSDIQEYIERVNRGESTALYREQLELPQKAKETAALKIRTADGIDYLWFKKKTGFEFLEIEKNVLYGLEDDGLIQYNKDNGKNKGIHLTKKGFLFCDSVSSSLL